MKEQEKVTSHCSGLEDIGNEHPIHANVSLKKQLLSNTQPNDKKTMGNIALVYN